MELSGHLAEVDPLAEDDDFELSDINLADCSKDGCSFKVEVKVSDDFDLATNAARVNAAYKQFFALNLQSTNHGEDTISVRDYVDDFSQINRHNAEDLTGDGGVLKLNVMCTANGNTYKEIGDGVAIIHYSFYLEGGDEPFDSSVVRNAKGFYRRGEMIDGVEIGLNAMRVGDKCIFLIASDYAYGDLGCPPRIPERASILAEVECLDLISRKEQRYAFVMTSEEMEVLTFDDAVFYCESWLKSGKRLAKKGSHKDASKYFGAAIRMLKMINPADDSEERRHAAIFADHALHLAVSQVELHSFKRAISLCNDVLRMRRQPRDVSNEVAVLICLANAQKGLSDVAGAIRSVERAQALQPTNKEISGFLEELDKLRKRQRDAHKDMCVRMISNPVKEEVATPTNESKVDEGPITNDAFRLHADKHLMDFMSSGEQQGVLSYPYSIKTEDLEYVETRIGEFNLEVDYLDEKDEILIVYSKNRKTNQ